MRRRNAMKEKHLGSSEQRLKSWLSRRSLLRGTAGVVLGAGLVNPNWVRASDNDDSESGACVGPKPIPGGNTGLKPYGIFIHHNPLNPAIPLADIHRSIANYRFRWLRGIDPHPRRGNGNQHQHGGDDAFGISGRYGLQSGEVHRHGRPCALRYSRLCLT